ncbi:MAG: hypothetical protein JSU93_04995 [Methanobacteriota archaeon]|nr:MAG: hypothetical protein JSU93_04995 [Euryarchaeota archaeon]
MMGKKSNRAESKKECPSCGLGVTEESMICEFCGWDFEEEDEWILQIEKLERDLMLEKQRFEPGTVDHMIESTLRTPAKQKTEPSASADEEVSVASAPAVTEPPEEPFEEPVREPPKRPVREETPARTTPPAAPKVRRVRTVKTPPPERVEEPAQAAPARAPPTRTLRRTRTPVPAQGAPAGRTEPMEAREPPVRKTRVVRKVKK